MLLSFGLSKQLKQSIKYYIQAPRISIWLVSLNLATHDNGPSYYLKMESLSHKSKHQKVHNTIRGMDKE